MTRINELLEIAKQPLDTYRAELVAYIAMNGATRYELIKAKEQAQKLADDITEILEG